MDDKTTRGAQHGASPAAHLLAAMTGDGRTVTQLRVPGKTNEITCFALLLKPFDLAGVAVTADALYTQRTHVRFLVEEKKAHYLLVVKAEQPELHRRLRSLPWKDVTAHRYDRKIGHDRRETREQGTHRHRLGLPSRPSASCATAPISRPARSATGPSARSPT
ncbi:transposase [Kitasatospora sp. NPDC057738]|uniref:transposase n=1 Tax=Kitasatospora sp. NPDC057738 TaxID=3346233 RepID=UPI0036CD13F1